MAITLKSSLITIHDVGLWLLSLCFVAFIAVLPISGTIALRHLVLLLGLVLGFWYMYRLEVKITLPPLVIAWLIYVCVFPWISRHTSTAWDSVLSQWGKGVLSMLFGAVVVCVLRASKREISLYVLGMVSAIPILIHIGLSLGYWLGWLPASGALFYGQDINVYAQAMKFPLWSMERVPSNFWGLEWHHANLGYAACQTTILLMALILTQWQTLDGIRRLTVVSCLLACGVSVFIAGSRAGMLFILIAIALTLIIYAIKAYQSTQLQGRVIKRLILVSCVALVVGGVTIVGAVKRDWRWNLMLEKIGTGWMGEPIKVLCEGTASIEPELRKRYQHLSDPQYQQLLDSLTGQDGGRIMALRGGFELSLKHPWGDDGTRQSFQHLLRHECPQTHNIFAHAHNGWIDTLLAIGWVGAIIYLLLLGGFFSYGLRALATNPAHLASSIALSSFAVFWFLRAFTDSVMRDHMMLMQGVMLMYFYQHLRMPSVKTEI